MTKRHEFYDLMDMEMKPSLSGLATVAQQLLEKIKQPSCLSIISQPQIPAFAFAVCLPSSGYSWRLLDLCLSPPLPSSPSHILVGLFNLHVYASFPPIPISSLWFKNTCSLPIIYLLALSVMDEASRWMWMSRRKSAMLSRLHSPTAAHLSYSYHKDSWEEQAFAEDSAGAALGGCIWPPRSYTCSFCRREFRSAQALGGHMNVHRRDRARLKQSSSAHLESSADSDQVSTLVRKPNPSLDANPAAAPEENGSDQTLVSPPSSSSPVQEHKKSFSFSFCDLKLDRENRKDYGEKEYVGTNSSVPSVGMVRQRSRIDEGDIIEKRRRKDGPLPLFITSDIAERRMIDVPLPFFLRPVSTHERQYHLRSEVLGLVPNQMDDLDLELRLGDRPKVT
ncbi:hypothetical protein ACLOJK_030095 [Asimina triloba]